MLDKFKGLLDFKWYLIIAVIAFSAGKMSNPAEVIKTSKAVEVDHSSTNTSTSTLGTKKSTTNAKTGITETTETLLTFSDSATQVDVKKLLETKEDVKQTLFGVYAGVGTKLDDWTHPFASFIITYKMFAFSLQSDLKLDHRIAGHMGLLF